MSELTSIKITSIKDAYDDPTSPIHDAAVEAKRIMDIFSMMNVPPTQETVNALELVIGGLKARLEYG